MLNLCDSNNTIANQFVGMQVTVALIDPKSNISTSQQELTKIGTTYNCIYLTLDYTRDEFIQNITFYYDSTAIRAIYATTNTGRVIFKG